MPLLAPLRPFEPGDLAALSALLERACAFERAGAVAHELLVEPGLVSAPRTMVAQVGDQLAGVAAASAKWLRVVAVDPALRGQGVGSALLEDAEQAIAQAGHAVVHVLGESGNYLAPGIDERDEQTIEWLERRGYVRRGTRHNLLIDVQSNPRVGRRQAEELAARHKGHVIRRAGPDDAGPLSAWIEADFSAGWAFEVKRALGGRRPGVHIAVVESAGSAARSGSAASGEIVAFAAHDGNNRGLGWFGPAGTHKDHRGEGLGKALLAACLADVAEDGHGFCEIAWIGPREFYQRAAGIAGERSFVVLRKELS